MFVTDPRRLGLRVLAALPGLVVRPAMGAEPSIDGRVLDPDIHRLLAVMKLGPTGLDADAAASARSRRQFVAGSRIVAASPRVGVVTERSIDGPAGPLRLRFYTPEGLSDASGGLVYFHGGGFIRGDLDSHDGVCRAFAEGAQIRVISVDYRLAPEHPFPAGVDDAIAAWQWVSANAESLNLLRAKIAVGGDSAGGGLATVVAQEMVRSGGPRPAAQLLAYPAVDFVDSWPSESALGEGFLLTAEFMDLVKDAYLVGVEDHSDPRLSPLRGDLSDLPPVVISVAGFDPLRDQNLAYVEALQSAGVPTECLLEDGLIHGYVNMTGYGKAAPAAVGRLISALQRNLV